MKRYRSIINGKLFDSLKADLIYKQKIKFIDLFDFDLASRYLIYKTPNDYYVKIEDYYFSNSIYYDIISEEELKTFLQKKDINFYLEYFKDSLEEL